MRFTALILSVFTVVLSAGNSEAANRRPNAETVLGQACTSDADCGRAQSGAESCRLLTDTRFCDGHQRYQIGCSAGICSKTIGLCDQCVW